MDNLDRPQMRTLVDQLRDKLGSAVVVLGSASNGNVSLIVGVTKDLTSRIQAGKIIGPVARKLAAKAEGVRIWPKRAARTRLRWTRRWMRLTVSWSRC